MTDIKIVSLGTFLPGKQITNKEMEDVLGIREDWIESMIGNETRHFAVNFQEKTVEYDLIDLCEKAALDAFEKSPLESLEEIDLIILSTATPDHLMPATVNLLADRLGLQGIPTYQIQAGCSGALQGLDVAQQFLKANHYKNALVVGGDVCNKYLDLNRDFHKLRSSELINYALFGDGAGAAILTKNTEEPGFKLVQISNKFEGLNREPAQIMNWIGSIPSDVQGMSSRQISSKYPAAKEDYKAIEEHVPTLTKEMFNTLLEENNWGKDKVHHFLPPQLGWNMTKKIIDFADLDHDKTTNCVKETGNNGNALPYVQLAKLREKVKLNEKVVGVAIESSKWIKTGIVLQYM
ncbi:MULTISPECIES: ketoacyl-ACP synthase III [Metabacillus]|uniref:3-oxoacyl-ACP synthase III family protein n=1 Tax=Metabacillus rhizolycopersici TaxID=2875709 RepID=A0ABS7URC3_9BACI|nr:MULTISPECIES: 3-oxoacyl-ACP synthase III family protein [Metabacillus]MBZ5750617.1 3-oxoacyl-ACP synthase III family protein [Metabacillus rhizolycopersici]MCM3651756.1 3-oxoacyl-ACP synthase III family protein [Metabacillus litoralis]